MTTHTAALSWLRIALANPSVDFRDGQWEAIDQLVNQLAMTTFRLFFFASASAAVMAFLAWSRVIAMPYAGAWALATAETNRAAAANNPVKSFL
ncbi:MAG: hypothetical protein U1A72_06650 [Sulfuritalea sp.]|nr:hypothetical protein [Sulfuritalea sp.]